MATYSYTVYPMGITFTVREISPGDVVRFYVRHDPEISSDPVIDIKETATKTSHTETFDGLEPETDYVINAGIVVGNTTSWIKANYITTPPYEGGGGGETPTRPRDWVWESRIKQGAPIEISASEWNSFCDRINEFREYDGLSAYNFTHVYKGDAISASIVNEARSAINRISTSENITLVSRGDLITADYFNGIAWALNQTK